MIRVFRSTPVVSKTTTPVSNDRRKRFAAATTLNTVIRIRLKLSVAPWFLQRIVITCNEREVRALAHREL